MYKYICVLVCIFVTSKAVQLPSYFTKCSIDDPNLGNCITSTANAALPRLLQGDKSLHVLNMKPLFVPHIYLDVGGNLQINITNASIFGLESIDFKYCKFDVKNKRLESEIYLDQAQLRGIYDINGKILILPINGHGDCNITLVKPTFKYTFVYALENIKNKEHLVIKNSNMTYVTERAYFQLDNLFNGDKALSDQMNLFLDENWKDVNGEIGARVGDALSEIFTSIIQQIFNRVPNDELFIVPH